MEQRRSQEIGVDVTIVLQSPAEIQAVTLICHAHREEQLTLSRAEMTIENRQIGRIDPCRQDTEESPNQVRKARDWLHIVPMIACRMGVVKMSRILLRMPGAMKTSRIRTPGPHGSS